MYRWIPFRNLRDIYRSPVFCENPLDRIVRLDKVRAVRQAVSCLPDSQREAIGLVDLNGFTEGEAALQLGISKSALHSRRHRAKRSLASDPLLKRLYNDQYLN